MSLPTPPAAPTCPRHPQREAWRACTRCQRVWCNECLVTASVGSHCVECVKAAQPPAAERIRRSLATHSFPATKVLLAANLAVFVILIVADPDSLNGAINARGWYDELGLTRFGISDGEPWRMITSGFIHFGMLHLAFNGYALWSLGQMLEPMLGTRKFTLLYFASLLAGSAGVLLIQQNGITGGASGAVFGLFGAAAVVLRHHGVNPFRTSIGTMLILNLVFTFARPGISIGGHLGGLAGGVICGLVLGAPRWKKVDPALQWGVPVAVMVVSVVVGLAVSG